MPDTFHTEELIERIILLSKVKAGMADAKAGRTLSMEEMREQIQAKWAK
jgi:predicted transcriptional regulator